MDRIMELILEKLPEFREMAAGRVDKMEITSKRAAEAVIAVLNGLRKDDVVHSHSYTAFFFLVGIAVNMPRVSADSRAQILDFLRIAWDEFDPAYLGGVG